jgi:hypothetical protein
MANLSKAVFFDAGANPPVKKVITVRPDGSRVEERMPTGVAKEIWVDKNGNECTVAMTERGAPAARQSIDAKRADLRANGLIEHHRCPLAQGTVPAATFPTGLALPCPDGSYGALRPCKHVQHLIAERRLAVMAKRGARDRVINAVAIREAEERKSAADQVAAQTAAVLEVAKSVASVVGVKRADK